MGLTVSQEDQVQHSKACRVITAGTSRVSTPRSSGVVGRDGDASSPTPRPLAPSAGPAQAQGGSASWSNGAVEDEDDWESPEDDSFESLSPVEEVVARFKAALPSYPPGYIRPGDATRLIAVVRHHGAAFGRKLRSKPIDCEPVGAELLEGATPVRAGYAVHDPEKREALRQEVEDQLLQGLAVWAPGNMWALPAFMVAKKSLNGVRKWRMVVNGQPLDLRTKSIGTEILDQKAVLARIGPARYRGAFDMLKGFYQVPLSVGSRELFGFMTPWGVLVPTRLPMGWKNSPAYLQLRLDEVFVHIEGLERWVDDFLVYGADFASYLVRLDRFLGRCVSRNVILKPTAQLCPPTVEFVGLQLRQDGWSRSPSTFGAVRSRPLETASDLAGLIGFFNFFSGTVPGLEVLIGPLREALLRVHRATGAATKVADRKVPLDAAHGWTPAHAAMVSSIWSRIDAGINMGFPDPKQRVMIITDASDRACAGVVFQVTQEEWAKAPHLRRGQVLHVYSHVFKGAEMNWTVTEKELVPLHYLVTKLDYLFLGRDIEAYTDHRNLVDMLSNPGILTKAQSARRVARRIMDMSGVRLTVTHIEGVLNVFCDYLSREGEREVDAAFFGAVRLLARQPGTDTTAAEAGRTRLTNHMVRGEDINEFGYPTLALVQEHMQVELNTLSASQAGYEPQADGLWYLDGDVFVPEALRAAFALAAHCGLGGHRGVAGTLHQLQGFSWPGREDQIRAEVGDCVHCMRGEEGVIQRPHGEVLHGQHVGEVMHWDYLEFPLDRWGRKYVLVGKDDVSQFVLAYVCDRADSETSVSKLRDFVCTHSIVPTWFTADQGRHFEGALEETLRGLGVQRKRHLVYTPQANGTVERVNRDLIGTVIALLSELGLSSRDWPTVLDLAVVAHNNAPSRQLMNLTPTQVFTGRDGIVAADLVRVSATAGLPRGLKPGELAALVGGVRKQFRATEERVVAHKALVRERQHNLRERRRNVHAVDFVVGDYVLVSATDGRPRETDKLSPRWQGPVQVVRKVSPLVFEVRYLGTGRREQVHAQRLRFYHGADLAITDGLLDMADLSLAGRFAIKDIVGIAKGEGQRPRVLLKVNWEGDDASDATWEPVIRLHQDAPALVEEYLDRAGHNAADRELVKTARASIARSVKARGDRDSVLGGTSKGGPR